MIDQDVFNDKIANGVITNVKNQTPETLLYSKIQRIEHTLF